MKQGKRKGRNEKKKEEEECEEDKYNEGEKSKRDQGITLDKKMEK